MEAKRAIKAARVKRIVTCSHRSGWSNPHSTDTPVVERGPPSAMSEVAYREMPLIFGGDILGMATHGTYRQEWGRHKLYPLARRDG